MWGLAWWSSGEDSAPPRHGCEESNPASLEAKKTQRNEERDPQTVLYFWKWTSNKKGQGRNNSSHPSRFRNVLESGTWSRLRWHLTWEACVHPLALQVAGGLLAGRF